LKRIFALALTSVMLLALLTVSAAAAETFDYARFTATGNDPYTNDVKFSAAIDMDTVKWAVVKYRTITQYDNTGVELIGQIYASPAAEPFIPVKYVHSQAWELTVVDMTSVSEKSVNESLWNSASGKDDSMIRFDPMESNRDAEANTGEDAAVISDGDQIDVAFIAFFDDEAKANAFDGTDATYVSIIDAAALAEFSSGNALSVELLTETAEAAETEAPVVDETPAETDAEAPVDTPAAPQTADVISVAAASIVIALGIGYISKKKR
jgi:hypothetical protein